MPEINENIRKELEHKHYGIVGRHSAVQICSWTKKALRGQGVCYKQKFYGIDCHRCAQFSPAAVWCEMNCVYCWRPMEFMTGSRLPVDAVDSPHRIIEDMAGVRKQLLSGFGGYDDIDMELYSESLIPNHYAISLSGEPTLYPRLSELVKILNEREDTRSTFLVTNGQEPEALLSLASSPPIQTYISVNAPNEEIFQTVGRPTLNDAWNRLKKSLEIWKRLDTRKIIRFTLIKGFNDDPRLLSGYQSLFNQSGADFIELKAYMHLGYSRRRLDKSMMPLFTEVKDFTTKLLHGLDYDIVDESPSSFIMLLKDKSTDVKARI